MPTGTKSSTSLRGKVLSPTLTVPEEGFSIIHPDCPWEYHDRLQGKNMRGAAEDHYSVLKPRDLLTLDIGSLAADDCALFLWTTGPQMDVAIDVMRAWGFIPKTMAFVWRKMNTKSFWTSFYGLGRWTRSTYEFCLLGTKGKPKRIDKGVRQEVIYPRMQHSAKPPIVRDRIVKLMGDIPRVELFAREQAPGWQATGLELDNVDIRDILPRIEEAK